MAAKQLINSKTSFSVWKKEEFLGGHLEFFTFDLAQNSMMSVQNEIEGNVDDISSSQIVSHSNISPQSLTLKNLNQPGEAQVYPVNQSIHDNKEEHQFKDDVLRLNKKKKSHGIKLKNVHLPVVDLGKQIQKVISYASFRGMDSEKAIIEYAEVGKNFFFSDGDSKKIFNLGHQFYRSYKKGTRHFSFSSPRESLAQQKSILGIASFIYYFENLKILIITQEMDKSYFSKFKANELNQKTVMAEEGTTYKISEHHGLCFLEVEEIERKVKEFEGQRKDDFLKVLSGEYDIIFYDLPDIIKKRSKYDVYFQILQLVENVTFSLSLKNNTFTEIEDLRIYFKNFNIKFNGCVIDGYTFSKGSL